MDDASRAVDSAAIALDPAAIAFDAGARASADGIIAMDSQEMTVALATRAAGGAVCFMAASSAGIFTAAEMLAAAGENPFRGFMGKSPL